MEQLLDITLLESLQNLEPRFTVTKVLPNGLNRHPKPIYIDANHDWAILDVSTPSHKMKFTIISLSDLAEVSQWCWKYTPYVNKKTGNTNEYCQTVVYQSGTKKNVCTTLNRVILFGFGSKDKLVSDHRRSNKLDNRREALQAISHADNLKAAARRPWEGAALVHSKKVLTPKGEFESITAAAKAHGLTPQGMSQKIRRGTNPDFRFVEVENNE